MSKTRLEDTEFLDESPSDEKIISDLEKLPQKTMAELLYKSLMITRAGMDKIARMEAKKAQEDEFNTYYKISLTFPCVDKVYPMGCYHTKELAKKVYRIVFEVLNNQADLQKEGGFDLRTDCYMGKIVKCPAGLRLEESGCAITMVETQLTCQELKKLGDWIPSVIEHAAMLRKEAPPRIVEFGDIVIHHKRLS